MKNIRREGEKGGVEGGRERERGRGRGKVKSGEGLGFRV